MIEFYIYYTYKIEIYKEKTIFLYILKIFHGSSPHSQKNNYIHYRTL